MGITAETRRESYEKLDSETLKRHILSILHGGSEITAREIAVVMHSRGYIPYPMRQAVAPRLTELVKDGLIKVSGKCYDHESKRNVATYRMVE